MVRRFYRTTGGRRTLVAVLVLLVMGTAARLAVMRSAVARAEPASVTWDDALSRFDARLARDVEADGVGGIVAGVAVDGELVWARAYGLANRETRFPMSASTVSRTGSISKSVTALLLMRLVDRGVVRLDDPVSRYLPEIRSVPHRDGFKLVEIPRPGAPEVTIRHLASHTAGLIREPTLRGASAGPIAAWEEKVLASIPGTAFNTDPGARYAYSNIGFAMLGLALSRAAAKPFIQLVEEEVFAPLGMTSSTFVVDAALAPRLAAGYQNGAGRIDAGTPAREHDGRGYRVPNGGVYSTVADLGRLAGALGGTPGLSILSEESRREMLKVQTPEDPQNGYGLGLTIQIDDDGRRLASHGGVVAGYTAFMAFDPDARIAVILLRNYQSGDTNLRGVSLNLVRQLVALKTPSGAAEMSDTR